MERERKTCVIAGGGPAGIMLGLLLARGGVDVVVLEKHGDFLRDFRGDTIHPSTIRVLDELGLGEAFRQLPQSRLTGLRLPAADGSLIPIADLSRLPAPYNYIALIPQWDFLDFLSAAARREPTFDLRMNAEVTGLRRDGDRVMGVTYRDRSGAVVDLEADLVVACDGRHSIIRREAQLVAKELPVPFDTWWFRLPRHDGDQPQPTLLPRFSGGDLCLVLNRDTFYQVAFFARKGMDAQLRSEGIDRFRARLASLLPEFADRFDAIASMDDVHLLDVKLNRLDCWHRPGLLLIGDAAHAMSPAGGVGINLAIQDAVATATLLREPLLLHALTEDDLARVQARRSRPTAELQGLQSRLQDLIFKPALANRRPLALRLIPLLMRLFPGLSRFPAQMIGFGPLPEHAPDFARR